MRPERTAILVVEEVPDRLPNDPVRHDLHARLSTAVLLRLQLSESVRIVDRCARSSLLVPILQLLRQSVQRSIWQRWVGRQDSIGSGRFRRHVHRQAAFVARKLEWSSLEWPCERKAPFERIDRER